MYNNHQHPNQPGHVVNTWPPGNDGYNVIYLLGRANVTVISGPN
jgi:hypothetical protein